MSPSTEEITRLLTNQRQARDLDAELKWNLSTPRRIWNALPSIALRALIVLGVFAVVAVVPIVTFTPIAEYLALVGIVAMVTVATGYILSGRTNHRWAFRSVVIIMALLALLNGILA